MREGRIRRSMVYAFLTLSLCGLVTLSAFQNCAPMESTYNPLFDSDLSFDCVGAGCERSLNAVKIESTVPGVMLDKRTDPWDGNTCDSTTCFDLGGYCDTGGYPGSVFYYQWYLEGTTPIQEVRTTAVCDDRGRFHVLVKVPKNQFDWNKSHRLRLFMKVLDEYGNEIYNPSGVAEWTYMVSVRSY